MNCPYCGKPMQSGYIQSGQRIMWSPEKKEGFHLVDRETDFIISKGFWNGCHAESWYCADCKKLITEVDTQSEK